MILTALIALASVIIDTILSIFPTSTGFPVEVHNAFQFLGGYVGILSPIVPLDTMATILTLIITFELVIFSFKAFKWLFGYVPLIGK